MKYRAIGATALLRRNLLIYGLGGMILPFVGIKLIDLDRPQPLRRVGASGVRGHYRILLGMAAGVGKTYRMLQEGRSAHAEGRDVVIGYLEPHDRPETTALAEGLEQVPHLRVGATAASSSRRWTSTPSSGARRSWR